MTLFVLVLPVWANAQCSMCKAVVESNMESNANSIGAGINDGIMYLMIFPYLVFGIVGYMIYRNYVKTKQEAK